MAPRGCVAVTRIVAVAMVCWLASAGRGDAQESGAQPSSARPLWSRLPGASEYEYDERVDLSLDGSAVVDVNTSIPALVALHGARLDVDPEARLDRQAVRTLFGGPGTRVTELSAFRRHTRRFVHVRLDVDDIRSLAHVGALSWSRYRFDRTDHEYQFIQDVGAPDTGRPDPPDNVGWNGSELVAFRIHLPSKINFHNSPDRIERGNTLVWEQPLRDRLAGAPLHMEARIETQSILYRTLWLFGGTFTAAMTALAFIVWWIRRRGRKASGFGLQTPGLDP
jgi:hypothetical protein